MSDAKRWHTRGLAIVPALALASVPLAYFAAYRAPGHRVLPYLALHALLTVLQLASWHLAQRDRSHTVLRMAVAVGLVVRIALIPVPAFTTTDVARYLWDGAVALDRHDPYAVPPNDPSLAALRARFPTVMDHHEVVTCYPPVAIACFATAASGGARHAFLLWKGLCALASCAAVLIAWWHLRTSEHAPHATLLALSPIALLEAGVGGHLDALAAPFVLLAVIAARTRQWDRSALFAGMAAALKLVPGLVALPLVLRAPRRMRYVLLCTVPLALSVGASLALGAVPLGSLQLFAQTWSFASPAWEIAFRLSPEDEPRARTVLALVALGALVFVALRRGALERNARDAFTVHLATTPVLYPWYAMHLATLQPLAPSRVQVLLMALLPLSYEVIDRYQATGQWVPSIVPALVLGVAGLLAFAVWAVAVRRRARPDARVGSE